MTHEFVEHTGEVELAIVAASEADVFAEALAALGELVEGEAGGEPVSFAVTASAADRGLLLVEFLGEILFLIEVERFVPACIQTLELHEDRLRATVGGHRGKPSHLVKAITIHDLEFRRSDEGWLGRVVLDV